MAATTLDVQVDHVLELIKIAGFIGGLGYTLVKVGRMIQKFEEISRYQSQEISELKTSVQKLLDSDHRIGRIEERLLMTGKRLDEIASRFNAHLDQQTIRQIAGKFGEAEAG